MFLGSLIVVSAGSPLTVLAAEDAAAASQSIPLWFCIPFAGLLFCIAVLPLIKPHWWESHQPLAVVFWSLLFILPFAFSYGAGRAAETVLECLINDYLTFIVLLFGLFCVSGNIQLDRDDGGQYADDPSGDQDECMAQEPVAYHCIFYLSGIQYRRLPDTHWGSAAFDGIFQRRSLLLESSSVSGHVV